MKTIHVALAGFGPGGRFFNAPIIDAIKALRITKILTSNPVNRSAAEVDFPEAKVVEDYDEILQDPEIELVVITTPNQFHFEYAEKALKAGKHVVVEKPLAPSVVECRKLIKLAGTADRILSVHHNRRWDSDIRTIKKLLDQGRLGTIVEYEAHFDRFRPEIKDSWKEKKENPGHGILYDLGSHLIDQALWLFGAPKEVFADLQIQRQGSEVADSFELLLFYPGLKVTLKAGMLVADPGPRYQVKGRKASFTKWGLDVQEEDLKKGLKPNVTADWGMEPKEIWGEITGPEGVEIVESERGDYRQFYNNIAKSIRGEEALAVTAEEACQVIRIIETALQSHRERKLLPFLPRA